MKINFKKWFKENATSTSCIATFSMPIGGAMKIKDDSLNDDSKLRPVKITKKKNK